MFSTVIAGRVEPYDTPLHSFEVLFRFATVEHTGAAPEMEVRLLNGHASTACHGRIKTCVPVCTWFYIISFACVGLLGALYACSASEVLHFGVSLALVSSPNLERTRTHVLFKRPSVHTQHGS